MFRGKPRWSRAEHAFDQRANRCAGFDALCQERRLDLQPAFWVGLGASLPGGPRILRANRCSRGDSLNWQETKRAGGH